MQVIPSAMRSLSAKQIYCRNMCRGCVAHPCMQACPKGAISMKDGKSYIDQDKCIKCGKCKAACPYDAISHNIRPCEQACGVKAIGSDEQGRASILEDKCVSCGMCMVSCPFGAISDKSQIFQLAHALRGGEKIIAIVAPAYISQFGDDVTPGKFKTALQVLGFSDVHEVAFGADVGAIAEAHHYAEKVATGELPFLLTSCCPSWSMMAKKFFPTMIDNISQELTPMVATARKVNRSIQMQRLYLLVHVHPRSWKLCAAPSAVMLILSLHSRNWMPCLMHAKSILLLSKRMVLFMMRLLQDVVMLLQVVLQVRSKPA